MTKLLITFWLKRFVLVSVPLLIVLGAVELGQDEAPDYASAVLWALVGGAVAASVNTYWARNRMCSVPGAGADGEPPLGD